MPTPRHHLASAVVDGKLYAIGGRNSNRTFNANLDANEVYDPKSNAWTSLQPMPTKRSGLCVASSSSVGGDIYVIGGESPFKGDETPDTTYDVNEKYDPQTNKWSTEQPMPTSRHGMSYASNNNRMFLIGGGPKPGMSVTGVNEIFRIPPSLHVSNFKTEIVFQGLSLPTNMAFLGPNDILVLEKDSGQVRRILNGATLEQPILDVSVANKGDRGMLGIAVSKNSTATNSSTFVFLYFTESNGEKDGKDDCFMDNCKKSLEPLGNRLYRYMINDNKLVNPKLLLDLPVSPGPRENSGVITIGPDKNVYLAVGDVSGYHDKKLTKAQNYENGTEPDGRAGILRVTQDGKLVGKGILGDTYPLDLYFAYGIRNSFGMDFDPVTGNLWNTENGPAFGDEINLVEPGFNSGWNKVQGIWKVNEFWKPDPDGNKKGEHQLHADSNLVDFNGRGIYSAPEFVWDSTVGPTTLIFFSSDKYGKEHENDMFVADINGRIYHFDLNEDRTGLVLKGSLEDKVGNTSDIELQRRMFGNDFGIITDLEIGPDGYLYVLSFSSGTIFRIAPDI
jgi:glucose/arabinose dehydrogenase